MGLNLFCWIYNLTQNHSFTFHICYNGTKYLSWVDICNGIALLYSIFFLRKRQKRRYCIKEERKSQTKTGYKKKTKERKKEKKNETDTSSEKARRPPGKSSLMLEYPRVHMLTPVLWWESPRHRASIPVIWWPHSASTLRLLPWRLQGSLTVSILLFLSCQMCHSIRIIGEPCPFVQTPCPEWKMSVHQFFLCGFHRSYSPHAPVVVAFVVY